MIQLGELLLCLPPLIFTPPPQPLNKFAEVIPYETLYQIDEPIKLGLLTNEDIVKEQNNKILKEIFEKELENEYLQHHRQNDL